MRMIPINMTGRSTCSFLQFDERIGLRVLPDGIMNVVSDHLKMAYTEEQLGFIFRPVNVFYLLIIIKRFRYYGQNIDKKNLSCKS